MDDQIEIEINLDNLLWYLYKRLWIIILVPILCAVVGFAVSEFVVPEQYDASTRIYILNRGMDSNVTYADYQISNQMVADYKILITGRNVTEEVIERLDLQMTSEELEKNITVTAPEDTRVLQITIRDADPQQAMDIANCVRLIASEQIKRIMNVDSVNLIYEATLPTESAYPNVMTVTLLCAAAGLITIIVLISVIFVADDTIRTEEDVHRYLGVTVLAVIPKSQDMAVAAVDKTGRKNIEFRRNES